MNATVNNATRNHVFVESNLNIQEASLSTLVVSVSEETSGPRRIQSEDTGFKSRSQRSSQDKGTLVGLVLRAEFTQRQSVSKGKLN